MSLKVIWFLLKTFRNMIPIVAHTWFDMQGLRNNRKLKEMAEKKAKKTTLNVACFYCG